MRAIKISEIFNQIEEADKNILMLLNADYSEDEKKLISHYGEIYSKEIRFVIMRELLFNKDNNILKFK